MKRMLRFILVAITSFILLLYAESSLASAIGIYLSQNTAQHSHRMNYFIREAQASGVNTFVIDTKYRNSRYAKQIKKVRRAGIRVVSRIVIFPGGGTHAQVTNKRIWAKKLALAKYAISLGAQEIQLDYIRYSVKTGASRSKAVYIKHVIRYFRQNLPKHIPLQIDIFGVAAHKPSTTIGQDAALFAPYVQAICPMVYPSHYEPFRKHATKPYNTVLKSTEALRRQLRAHPNVKVYPYLELYNYRYPMSRVQRLSYTREQIQAAMDAGADGYYMWSARNQYGVLFQVLKSR